jgi:uncharacterized protein (DUF433 family)
MDWTGCEFVERIPGKVSGQPMVRGTAILADSVLDYSDEGVPLDEIIEDFPALTVEMVQALIAFAHSRRGRFPQA